MVSPTLNSLTLKPTLSSQPFGSSRASGRVLGELVDSVTSRDVDVGELYPYGHPDRPCTIS
jgi:hypothetical protein